MSRVSCCFLRGKKGRAGTMSLAFGSRGGLYSGNMPDADAPLLAPGYSPHNRLEIAASMSCFLNRTILGGEHRKELHGNDRLAALLREVFDNRLVRDCQIGDPLYVAQRHLER